MRWTIGDVTISKVIELEVTGGSRFLLPQATPEAIRAIPWLIPHFADEMGKLTMSIHTLLVETPDMRILVDTCLGNDKQDRVVPHWNERQGTFLADIAAAGFPAESIDVVLCTHLHVDHVGWNTKLVDGRWQPTFSQARYLFGRTEYEHWRDHSPEGQHQAVFDDSVMPIIDAGLVELVETDHRLCEEVRLMPSHGHTPGHVSVLISSRGEEAMITGDFLHHPCQMAHLDWSSTADSDPKQAEQTRREIFSNLAGKPVLVIGTHFAGPSAGHVVRDRDAFKLDVEKMSD